MDRSFDPTVFSRTHRLDGGLRVRLRLARPGDQRPLVALLERLGYTPSESELLDLVRFDPQRRAVICATALIGGRERILGFGAVENHGDAGTATIVAEPEHAAGVSRLLRRAINSRRGRRRDRSAGVVLSSDG
jgi:hypothetical protein